MAHSYRVQDKISRVHLAEEFCHVRLFNEMLCTCGLDRVEWVPLGPIKEKIYEQFPKIPGVMNGLRRLLLPNDGRDFLLPPVQTCLMRYWLKNQKYVTG